MPRLLHELIEVDEPAWDELEGDLRATDVSVDVLPIEPDRGARELYRIQVTARSYLGALALHTGGLLIDHGWVRVLGGGHTALPSLAEANRLPSDPANAGAVLADMLVGYDILGGQFVVNGSDPASNDRPGEPGHVCYYAPDSMEWESLEMGHGTWLYWLLTPDRLAQFYQGLRWTGWQADIAGLPLDQGISVFPPPWSKEAHDDFDATSRRPVSIYELFSVHGGPPRPLTGG